MTTQSTNQTSQAVLWLFRTSAVLWAIWGFVHIFAGYMTMSQISAGNVANAIHGITSVVPLEQLELAYPTAVGALLSQHGFNLAWFGVVTFVAAPFIWRRLPVAVFIAALVGGLADMGYFIYIDLGGFALPPGPQMTWICAGAILTGLTGIYLHKRTQQA